MELMDERVEGWPGIDERGGAIAMDKACTDPALERAIE